MNKYPKKTEIRPITYINKSTNNGVPDEDNENPSLMIKPFSEKTLKDIIRSEISVHKHHSTDSAYMIRIIFEFYWIFYLVDVYVQATI
jgi:hypothetical protein